MGDNTCKAVRRLFTKENQSGGENYQTEKGKHVYKGMNYKFIPTCYLCGILGQSKPNCSN